MQEIADRNPSDSEYLFPFIKSADMQIADREVKRVRENVMRALKELPLVATYLSFRQWEW